MLIAQQKLRENIAEYIIYMYHVEDIIRAFNFDLDEILKKYVKPQLPDESFMTQYRQWYGDLIHQMKMDRIEKEGHLQSIKDYIIELNYLHKMLIDVLKEEKYINLFDRTLPLILEFADRANLKEHNHIEVAFHSQYMKLLMRLRKQEISAETEEAMDEMRIYLAFLSNKYHQMQSEN